MSFQHVRVVILLLVISWTSGCQGCRENTSLPKPPEEKEQESESSPASNAENDSKGSKDSESEQTETKLESEKSGSEKTSAVSPDATADASLEQSHVSDGTSGSASSQGESGEPAGYQSSESVPSSAPSNVGSGSNVAAPTLAAPKFKTPEEAIAFAQRLQEKSQRSIKNRETSEAYQQALQGWQALQPHTSDQSCRELSSELLADLEKFGEALGSKGQPIVGKPLKIK